MNAGALRALLADCRAVQVNRTAWLRDDAAVDAVVVIGPSGAGKSTLVAAVRASPVVTAGRVDVPLRFVTRPCRDGETAAENRFLTAAAFARAVAVGDVGLHWVRQMEGDRIERYGFARPLPSRLAVYSGNDALRSENSQMCPAGALDRALWLGVCAPVAVRGARLQLRSPNLAREAPAELQHRLHHTQRGVLETCDILVHNHGPAQAYAVQEFVALVAGLLTPSRP